MGGYEEHDDLCILCVCLFSQPATQLSVCYVAKTVTYNIAHKPQSDFLVFFVFFCYVFCFFVVLPNQHCL